MTRKEVKRWFQPLSDFCKNAIKGDVDSVRGYPITYIATKKVYSRVDLCIEGVKDPCYKFMPDFDYSHLDKVRMKLEHGIPLEHADIEEMHRSLKLLEDKVIRIPYEVIMSSVRDIMIAIHMRSLMNENNPG